MPNIKNLHYFGKLRRRREFIRSILSSQNYYYDWEVWFNKCSQNNSLLPFLNRNNKSKPIWFFMIVDQEVVKVGFTALSSDLSERKYPFLLYFENDVVMLNDYDKTFNETLKVADNYQNFSKIIAGGEMLNHEDFCLKKSTKDFETVPTLQQLLDKVVTEIVENKNHVAMSSYWINLDNFFSIHHQGPLTCTLYNKIYG